MMRHHFHCMLAGILVLTVTPARGASPPAGRAVFRLNETVTLTKCDIPDSPPTKTNYTRTGYLLLDSQVAAGDWVRVVSEFEAEGTNGGLPLLRSELLAQDEKLRAGRGIPWGASADGVSVMSSHGNEDPMGEGAPLAPEALALPTVLPARALAESRTNAIRLRFAERVFPLAYAVRSNSPTGQRISLSRTAHEQRGAAGVWQLQPDGQWTVTYAKDGLPETVEGEFQLTWRQRWKADGEERNVVIFSVASRFVYSRWHGADFDNERIFERKP